MVTSGRAFKNKPDPEECVIAVCIGSLAMPLNNKTSERFSRGLSRGQETKMEKNARKICYNSCKSIFRETVTHMDCSFFFLQMLHLTRMFFTSFVYQIIWISLISTRNDKKSVNMLKILMMNAYELVQWLNFCKFCIYQQ